MKKLLLLGSNGFVAKHLKSLLENKYCDYMILGKKDLDLTDIKQCKSILGEIDFKNYTIIFLQLEA